MGSIGRAIAYDSDDETFGGWESTLGHGAQREGDCHVFG